MTIQRGTWLGIDVGSAQKKVCSFCLIESDGAGGTTVSFEQGPARDPYPGGNSRMALIGVGPPWRRPIYLKEEIEAEVREVLNRATLVGLWLERSKDRPSAVAVDAPVAFATAGTSRLTEEKSTDTFKTPTRATFETQLGERKDEYLRINVFWKCVGLAVYRHLAARLELRLGSASLETIAARTCARDVTSRRIRETFPSDVYKRANGYQGKDGGAGILSLQARDVLKSLVEPEWRGAGREPGHHPASQTLDRLREIRKFLRLDLELEADRRLCEMRKRPGRTGDLWDAFTCAFACCCEHHGGAELHGWSDDPAEQQRLRAEGAILTVRRKESVAPSQPEGPSLEDSLARPRVDRQFIRSKNEIDDDLRVERESWE